MTFDELCDYVHRMDGSDVSEGWSRNEIIEMIKEMEKAEPSDLKIIIKKKEEPAPDTPALRQDTPSFAELFTMRIQVQNEYGKMTNKQLYEWIILNKKTYPQKIRKNQKKEELLNLIVLIKLW